MINVVPDDAVLLKQIAGDEDRAVGYVARELMLRGLALYKQDGKLKGEPSSVLSAGSVPISKVAARIEPGKERNPTKEDARRMLDTDSATLSETTKRRKTG